MALIGNVVSADEKTWQMKFYETIFGSPDEITVDRSTDGYTKGIIFEHKQNVTSYGRSKALSQALIYLCRFNRDGIPVPAKICLVSQDEKKCYIYETDNYIEYVENIEKYANLKASDGIPGFEAGAVSKIIEFDMNNVAKTIDLVNFVQQAPSCSKVHITAHNVYGWSGYYYEHAPEYKQKPEKKSFFSELRNPKGTLEQYIYPWEGEETDFKYIMDMLNDPMTQKKLGAFYTPPQYAKLAVELVKKAIERVPNGNDYIILDRCAGTGNLEMYLDDIDEDILSHVIVSTYELKEWMVLKDRFGSRVRYIIPPIPQGENELPALDKDGFLSGADALTKDIIDNKEIRKYIDNPKCSVILFENPPYVETTGIEFQKKKAGKDSSGWKNTFVLEEMKKEVSGAATNDMTNAFIWSAFKYFLRQPTDSYIVFSPVKYWKGQHLISKKFLGGFAFNRLHFHAKTNACVMCAYWSNEEDKYTSELELKAVNLVDGQPVEEGLIKVKAVNNLFSDTLFDNRPFADDTKDGIFVGLDGKERENGCVDGVFNSNIIAYCSAHAFGFDNPRLTGQIHTTTRYNGHGFYVRDDNFMEKLPMFAASRYTDHYNDWKVMSMIMKSGDKAIQYEADVKQGKLDVFLFKTLFWTCMSHYPHMRSLEGSDKRLYINQLCFDGNTLAKSKYDEFISNGYTLTEEEQILWDKMQHLLEMVKECEEYKSHFKYGLYQIDEEINIKIQTGVNSDGTPKLDYKYGDLNNLIKSIKALAKEYYVNNLVDKLFEYEFLK